jgi:RTX calcium-binding nonapeptide repeat (4 copies)/FG-GAP-like repeat
MAIINGTAGPDTLDGTPGNDTINGLGGNDDLRGGAGDDLINGGDGDDAIFGETGNDLLFGGAGNDVFFQNFVVGSTGRDFIVGGPGIDTVYFGHDVTITRLANGSLLLKPDFYPLASSFVSGVERLHLTGTTAVFSYAPNLLDLAGSDFFYYSTTANTLFARNVGLDGTVPIGTPEGPVVTRASFGAGTFQVQVTGDFKIAPVEGTLGFADGFADYIVKNTQTGEFLMSFGQGAFGTETAEAYRFTLGIIGTDWNVVSTGDFNADGGFDILWRNATTGQVYAWTMDNSRSPVISENIGVFGTDWIAGTAGDFDRDGDSDVLLQNRLTGQVYIATMQDGRRVGGATVQTFGADWRLAATGDFNADGFSDIALKNTVTGQFYLLLMQQGYAYTGSNLGVIGTDWNMASVGDYNRDNVSDILWRNSATNQVYLWAMDEGRQAATGSAPYGFLAADQIII